MARHGKARHGKGKGKGKGMAWGHHATWRASCSSDGEVDFQPVMGECEGHARFVGVRRGVVV